MIIRRKKSMRISPEVLRDICWPLRNDTFDVILSHLLRFEGLFIIFEMECAVEATMQLQIINATY